MSKLECEKKTVLKVNYSDLENYITEIYGQELCIPEDQECQNDVLIEINIGDDEKLDKYGQKRIDSFIENGTCSFLLIDILIDLATKQLIEKGTYIIDVSW